MQSHPLRRTRFGQYQASSCMHSVPKSVLSCKILSWLHAHTVKKNKQKNKQTNKQKNNNKKQTNKQKTKKQKKNRQTKNKKQKTNKQTNKQTKKSTWFITVQSLEILVTRTVKTIYTINAPSIDTRCPQRVCTNDAFISSCWCVRVWQREVDRWANWYSYTLYKQNCCFSKLCGYYSRVTILPMLIQRIVVVVKHPCRGG